MVKSQITKLKSQINPKSQNSNPKHVWNIGDWNLDIVCFLSFGAWNLLNSKTLLYLDTQNIFARHNTKGYFHPPPAVS